METVSRFFRSRYFWYAFAAMTVFVYLFGLTIPLLGPDEPRYSQVAREMFQRGDWVTTTLGGFNWFEKPALLYWLQIASYNIFGVNEFAARFGSAIFGLGTVAYLWILGRKVADATAGSKSSFGEFLGMIGATTLGLIVFARGASFDIILTFPITASLVGFFLFDLYSVKEPDSRRRYLWLACFYFFIGVALLAKGLVGIVFPLAIVAFYHTLRRQFPSKMLILSSMWGLPLSVLVASAWYLPMYLTNGWQFIDEFFIQHHFQRYTSNKYQHPQPFHFFFWVLPLMTIPWIPFFLIGIWSEVRKTFSTPSPENEHEDTTELKVSPNRDLFIFALSWLAVPLIFFSFSGSKLPGYILPAVPPAMIITALYVYRWIGDSERREVAIKALAVGFFGLILGLLIFVVPKYAEIDSVKSLVRSADQKGYGNLLIAGAHTVSHNAEFYAAGRLLRDTEGKQKRLTGPASVAAEMDARGISELLLLVPIEWLHQFESPNEITVEVLGNNGDLAIIRARRK